MNSDSLDDLENSIEQNAPESSSIDASIDSVKWLDNDGNEVVQVFGFNKNAELVNGRAAMVGFLMLILTELIFLGEPVTKTIFGINQ